MNHASAEYNGDLLTPDQIDTLHAAFVAELDAFAAPDAEPEAEAEPELEIEP